MEIPYLIAVILVYNLRETEGSARCHQHCSCLENYVDCSNLRLTHIPDPFPVWLRILDLSGNKLQGAEISEVVSKYKNLTELKLDKNSFTTLPIYGAIPTLTSLSLSHNKISGIESVFWDYVPALESLNISHNLISNITVGMFPSSHLIFLNLNNNRIGQISKGSFDSMKQLGDLKLSRNNLSFLRKDVLRNLSNLRTLELNRNYFTQIEGLTFQGLEKLVVLKIRQNSILDLFDGAFYGLHSLRILRLDGNSITQVNKGWLYGLTELQELYLGHNRIQQIQEDAWEACKHLLYLDLSHNELCEIKVSTFKDLSKLQHLKLDNNKIASISEGAFNFTPSLDELDLNNNNISWIVEDMSGAFYGLNHLRKLGLAANEITSINNKAFIGLDSLVHLDLSKNNIKAIQDNAFYGMHLEVLMVNTSSLLCDCALAWLSTWVKTNSLEFHNVYCAYPKLLQGKKFMSILSQNFLCSENDRPKPIITVGPKSVVSISGSPVNLYCSASSSSNSTLKFKWRRNNGDIAFLHSTVVNNTATLRIPEVTLANAGKYQCVVSNHFGTVYSSKANLTVLVLPTMIKKPGNVTVRAGSPARLECAAIGEPTPQVGWQKDGGTEFPAAQERRMHVMPTDDVFFIVNTKPADSGLYSCTAKNSAGTVIANATLTVLEAPSFSKKMEDKEVGIGKSAVLECMAKGWPKPKLRWRKDGVLLSPTQRHYFAADDQLLIIIDVKINDGGIYQCEIANSLGTDKGIAQLKIASMYGCNEDITGVIIIAVVCCAVGTSAVWVIIIYQTQRRLRCVERAKTITTKNIHLDTKSEHSASSKDSGTGDSTKRSRDDLRIAPNGCVQDFNNEVEGVGELHIPLLNVFTASQDIAMKKANPSIVADSCAVREITRSNHDRCPRPSSTPLNRSTLSLTSIPHPNSYLCLYIPPKPAQI